MKKALSKQQVRARARRVKLLLLDVDGVMTDGRISYVPQPDGGIFETKAFHSRDGIGIRYARAAGLKVGVITGRSSAAVDYRAQELELDFMERNALKKIPPYENILRAAMLRDREVCYVGDDLVDLPILKRVGLAVAVENGHPTLRQHVHYVTQAPGGSGAVREIIEIILEAQGKWKPILEGYMHPAG
jgi:3-deoxy-D-manno-octulosonate 8-phosphate phosphatase (KDO 8-P phosphatase)